MPAARRGARVKIVADTNTLVSGFLWAGPSAQQTGADWHALVVNVAAALQSLLDQSPSD